jgi:hypothetical protein
MGHDRRSRENVHLLWGRSDRFPRPQFIAGFNAGLVDAWAEEYSNRREEAIADFLDFCADDREGWTFWTTLEALLVVTPPFCASCRLIIDNDYATCECEDPVPVTACECNPRGEDRLHERYCPRYVEPAEAAA